MDYADHLLKTFTDRVYRHTVMVTHKGTLVAFAMDDQRRISYTVLNLDKAASGAGLGGGLGDLDVKYWEEPRAVPFPREISQVGYSVVNPTKMPVVKKDSGGAEADAGELRPEEIDLFRSTTARMTADAPLQALSDGKFIYLFRQSTAKDDPTAVFKTKNGGASAQGQRPTADYVVDAKGALVPIADCTLLVDRFVLTGATLAPKMEVRYRRSRNKHVPQSAKDSLGAEDMNQQPFHEPTHELDFVRGLRNGRFSVLLLPTQVAEVMAWQIFAYNSGTAQIDSFNVERSADGLFNTQGTTFYTSPDPQYRASVFEREPGTCPFTGDPLIPLVESSGYAETALLFNGTTTKMQVTGYQGILGDKARTVEAWIKTTKTNVPIVSWGSTATSARWTFLVQSANGTPGALRVEVSGGYVVGQTPVNDGQWHHVACTFDASAGNDVTAVRLYVDGVLEQTSATLSRAINTAVGIDVLLGSDQSNRYFDGQIDEVRIWDRARGALELLNDMGFRLSGNEPGLAGYWRFDEGRGCIARDQSGNGRNGTIFARPAMVLALNGTTDYVDCGQLDFARNGYTVEAWFKADATLTDQRAIFAATAGANHGILLEISASGTLRCHHRAPTGTGSIAEFFTALNYRDGRWHHVAAVKNDTSVTLYVDGGKVGTAAATTHFAEPLGIAVGRLSLSQASRFFKGSLAEVRVWSHARSQGEIQAYALRRLAGTEAGLMGYWPLDDGAGAAASERTGKAPSGTVRGTPVWNEDLPTIEPLPPLVTPATSSAVSFDGINDKIDVPWAAALNPESFTIEAWVLLRTTGRDFRSPLTSRHTSPMQGYILYATDSNRWAFWVGNGVNFSAVNGPSIVLNTWAHLAGTYDKASQTMRFYVDGVEVATLANVTYAPNGTSPLRIGAGGTEGAGTYFHDGKIMEVRVWNRVRSAQEIQADMKRRVAGTEAGLVGYWPLNEGTGTVAKDCTSGARNGTLVNAPTWVADAPGIAPAPRPVFEGTLRAGSLERPEAKWSISDAPVGERAGFHRSSFSIVGRSIVSGLTSVLYHQQEQAMVGYDREAKPVKRNARVMLAVSTADAMGGGTPSFVAALDFGISRHGRLAQAPDLIDLGAPLTSDANKDLSRLQELEQLLKAGSTATEVQTEADQIRKRLSVDVALPMPLVNTDAYGLTIAGGLLGFAYTSDTPYLFDSATGKLALYFRGETGQFFAAHYDTSTTRAQLRMKAGGGELVFAARAAESEADQTTVTVSDGPTPTLCTVVIANAKMAITETWKRVPRHGLSFAAVLNGQGSTPVFLGTLAGAANGPVTSLSLAEGARRPLEAGDTLLVGDTKVVVAANSARGTKALSIVAGALSAASGTQVSLLPYDYSVHAATNRPIDRLERGSLFFSVVPNGAGVVAQNGSAVTSAITPSCHWTAESPGSALFFQRTSGFVSRQGDASALAKLDAAGDLTLEAWINPVAVQGTVRVLHHLTDGSRYTLGLQDASVGQAALKLDGVDDVVDFKASLLNGVSSFTIEAWIRPSTKTGSSRGIIGQRHVMELMFWDDGTLRVVGNYNEVNPITNVPYPYATGEWHHVAVTGNGRDLRIYIDGVRQYGQTDGWSPTQPFTTYGTSTSPSAAGFDATLSRNGLFGRFAGDIDEIRYWSYARSQSDIREAMNRRLKGNESGLLGYWYFSNLEITQGRVLDRSGNGRHGYLSGGPVAAPSVGLIKGNVFFAGVGDQFRRSAVPVLADTWQHLAAVYRQSYALAFDGKDDVLAIEHGPALNLTRDLTIEVFFQTNEFTVSQGLLSKGQLLDGTAEAVPYALYVAEGGKLAFDYEDKSGTTHHFESNRALTAGTFYRVAVTRKHDVVVENKGTETSPDVKVNNVTTVNFYMNQTEAGSARRFAPTAGENTQQLRMGAIATGNKDYRLKGILSEVRLWNRCLTLQEIARPLRGDEENLVAWWRMEENEGGVTRDAKGEHHAAIQGPAWAKNPDPDGSLLTLYHNGSPILAEPMAAPEWYNTTKQFTLGASRSGNDVKFPFQGTMEEVRIWKTARGHEQILDNLFSRLKGEKQDLIANYTFDEGVGTVVQDQGLRGNHLALGGGTGAPAWTLSTAPVSTDIAPVRSALAGIKTAFHDVISSSPTVQEYADLQIRADGNLGGVMKRCYAYVKDGTWQLMTGYKVGNLITEWVGQVQADPQIIGYIEGAPPVPSENMTSTSAKVGEYTDYNGTSVIELEEPKTVNYVFSSSSESGYDMAFDLSSKTGLQSKSEVGIGFISEVENTAAHIGMHSSFESSTSNINQAESSFGRNVTKTTRMELHGYWEEPENQGGKYINPAIGRRYIPENNGLALVQSDTMDVFALRLAHNGALVAYRMRPNPDIPKDWNILMFPINPRYVKQGTLDGRVGAREDGSVQVDPDYPQATQYGEYSYFKPREAYALKKRIEREQQALATYYEQYNSSQSISNQSNGSDVPQQIAARNLANTYVWTAEGGFFAETSEVMEATSESTSGSYSFVGMSGIQFDFNLAVMKTATTFEIEALFGGHLETSKSRSRQSEESFKISVSVAPDSDLQLHVNTEAEAAKYAGHIDQESLAAWHPDGSPVLRPGRVDAYRFMTFYLEPARENFEDFFNKVVDPIWLAQSDNPDAMALRKSQQVDQKPRCWRIMHRVTFVSRIVPAINPGTQPTGVQQAMALADVPSNWALIKKLEPFVRTQTESYSTFASAVEQTLSTYLPELLPHTQEITRFAASYFGVNSN